jgi:hypothetical protein
MARHLVRGLWLAVAAASLTIQGCGQSPSSRLERTPHPASGPAAAADVPTRPEAGRSWRSTERLPLADAMRAQSRTDDPPPWLTELLHSPDPNVRIQGLDAWARNPSTSLDPVTYALVDPDEPVRARAQELFEQELARR